VIDANCLLSESLAHLLSAGCNFVNPPSTASRGPSDDQASSIANAPSATGDLLPLIERALEAACRFDDGCPARLAEAIRYAVLSPGKRLRPCLVLMAAEACGGRVEEALPGAVAVELIHAYSLIHDDLPAMDDDDLRRGRPTVHVAFDEATAILAGDALQPMAFEHLAASVTDSSRAVMAIHVLANASGPTQLVGGQADDLAAEKRGDASEMTPVPSDPVAKASTLRQLESIHRRKTGALFAASLDLGAILVGASDSARDALGNYARELGLAFQVTDDLLDCTADAAQMGKRTGKDQGRGKLTFPGLMGADQSRIHAKKMVKSAQEHASFFGDAAWRLAWLANYVLERSH
jgi:geranylgeranyl diphosphate synthase type II